MDTGCGVVYEALYTSSGTTEVAVPFVILDSVFTKHVMMPAIVYAGQGPVTLTITDASGKALERSRMSEPPFLIPCPNDCSEKDKDEIAELCSRPGFNGDVVRTEDPRASDTDTDTITFFAPVTPAASYMVCFPYCDKADN
eukprot:Tbor_TRINITY_DN5647_c4_g1::TRINITY_DN5647_c4_g1_i11::g.8450::m.8450